MIRSDAELHEFKVKLLAQVRRLGDYRTELRRRGIPKGDIRAALGPIRAYGAKLKRDVDAYERVKEGELPTFVGVENLGEALVSARLAVGVSQRELALRLGVNESIISRDEKSAYRGITAERAAKLFNALGLSLSGVIMRTAIDGGNHG